MDRGLLGPALLQTAAHPHGHHLHVPVVKQLDEGMILWRDRGQVSYRKQKSRYGQKETGKREREGEIQSRNREREYMNQVK